MAQQQHVYINKGKGGYVVLISMLVVSAVAVAVTVALLRNGLAASQTSFAAQQSAEARTLADACAEEALQEIRSSTPYTGSDTLSIGNGSCTYTVVSTGGQNRTITAQGTVGTMVRKVKVTISTINPKIIVGSWQEVANF